MVTGAGEGLLTGCTDTFCKELFVFDGAAEDNGAPTASSHLWPGFPWAGFNFTPGGGVCRLGNVGVNPGIAG